MKKIISTVIATVMLISICSVFTYAQWGDYGYSVVIGDSVRFRYGPSTDYDVVPGETVTYGDSVGLVISSNITTDTTGREWLSTGRGWICMDYVTTYFSAASISYGKVVNVSSNLAVRKGPTTNAPSIGSLKNGTEVTVLAETHFKIDNHIWYMISYGNNGSGWVAADYIQEKK